MFYQEQTIKFKESSKMNHNAEKQKPESAQEISSEATAE